MLLGRFAIWMSTDKSRYTHWCINKNTARVIWWHFQLHLIRRTFWKPRLTWNFVTKGRIHNKLILVQVMACCWQKTNCGLAITHWEIMTWKCNYIPYFHVIIYHILHVMSIQLSFLGTTGHWSGTVPRLQWSVDTREKLLQLLNFLVSIT